MLVVVVAVVDELVVDERQTSNDSMEAGVAGESVHLHRGVGYCRNAWGMWLNGGVGVQIAL